MDNKGQLIQNVTISKPTAGKHMDSTRCRTLFENRYKDSLSLDQERRTTRLQSWRSVAVHAIGYLQVDRI